MGLVECGEHDGGRHGQLADADAGGVVESIADCGSGGDDPRGFPDAGSVRGALTDVGLGKLDLDLGDFIGAGNLVLVEVGVDHQTVVGVEEAVLEERVGDALNDAAVDLAYDLRGVDGTAAIVDGQDAFHMDAAGLGIDGYLGNIHEETKTEQPALVKQIDSLQQAVIDLRRDLLSGNALRLQANSLKLAAFQQAFFTDIQATFEGLQNQDNSAPLRAQDLPQAMHDRFVGVTGKYLLMVYPKGDIWNRAVQKVFIDQVGKVYANVTGTPVQLYHYTELLKDSYQQAAWYSLGAIAILVFIHFRSVACVVLALVPVAIGSLWLGGLMGGLGVPLNPANIMTLPLVIGIGVTNGIHILNRFAEEQTANILARSTGKAVLVSGLTSMAGFGSLILAQHRGIHSLGCVMTAGLATCMIAGLTFLPALLNLLMRPPGADRTTQCRQCTIDTGSGGTEVKTSSMQKDYTNAT